MTYHSVILVDEKDQPLGIADKMIAHQEGLLHRAFSVFVFYQGAYEPELLLQQRPADKYHSPNLWTNSCCSHPQPHEHIVASAQRRLLEEMGITVTLRDVGGFHYRAQFDNGLCENEMDHVLIGLAHDQQVPFNPQEVQAVHWKPLSAVLQDLIDRPQHYTAWFAPALELAIRSL